MRKPILFVSMMLYVIPGLAQVPPDPGVKVGETIPGFQLPDQNGKQQSLASLAGPKGLMLVFYRSADW
jgi:hypothetical protein